MLQVGAGHHFRMDTLQTEANVSADMTSVVSADKTPVVSADKTSVVSLCQQTSPKTSPRHSQHRGGRFAAAPVGGMLGGMSWETVSYTHLRAHET